MKRFIKINLVWLGIYLSYKLLIGGIVLMGKKEPLHSDLGLEGKNKDILIGSSNVYINYDFLLLNKLNHRPIRSCWMPSTYGLALNLYKLEKIANKGDRLIFEFPYHWFLYDAMAPHNASFYSKADLPFYGFLLSNFPLEFLGHWVSFSAFHSEWRDYLLFPSKNNNQNSKNNQLSFEILVDSSYYRCDLSNYQKIKHNIQTNTFQNFQLKKIRKHLNSLSNSRNVSVYYNFPAMEKGNYSVNPQLIQAIGQSFLIITPFKESIWEEKYQFDKRYHLNHCGAILNSQRLAQKLNRLKN